MGYRGIGGRLGRLGVGSRSAGRKRRRGIEVEEGGMPAATPSNALPQMRTESSCRLWVGCQSGSCRRSRAGLGDQILLPVMQGERACIHFAVAQSDLEYMTVIYFPWPLAAAGHNKDRHVGCQRPRSTQIGRAHV